MAKRAITNPELSLTAEQTGKFLEYAPSEGFKATDELFGKPLSLGKTKKTVARTTGNESFVVEAKSGSKKHDIHASEWRRSRIMSKSGMKGTKPLDGYKNVFLSADNDAIWNSSSYYHEVEEMDAAEGYQFPSSITPKMALVASDVDGNPRFRVSNYQGADVIIKHYQSLATPRYPSYNDLVAELAKDKSEGRIEGLNAALRTPIVKEGITASDLSKLDFRLIFEDVVD